jgi:hypothetical protein
VEFIHTGEERTNVKDHRLVGLLATIAVACGPTAHAEFPLNGISVIYHGGPLIQHINVAPLLYGSPWQGTTASSYIGSFLQSLFANGRFMANLSQYSDGGYIIGNGSAVEPVPDLAVLATVTPDHAHSGVDYQVTDDQIQTEIKNQITNRKLPQPDAHGETLYLVCIASNVIVIRGAQLSGRDFIGYHATVADTTFRFPYAVVCPTTYSTSTTVDSPTGYRGTEFNRAMTGAISHELAEVVTDPHPPDGWVDQNKIKLGGGEIGDIPATLRRFGFITDDQWYDVLTGGDGTKYTVERMWSNLERAPVAFAPFP